MPNTVEGLQRLAAVEVQIKGLDGIPERLAALEAQVKGMTANLYREMDGLREQQKAHKEELKQQIDQQKIEVMERIDANTAAVRALTNTAISGRSSLRTLLWAGSAVGGGAVALGALWGVLKGLFHISP